MIFKYANAIDQAVIKSCASGLFGLGFRPSLSKRASTDGTFHPPFSPHPVDCVDFTDLTSTLPPPLGRRRGPPVSLHDLLIYSFDLDHLRGVMKASGLTLLP